jgi:hypothetical protein
MDSRKFGREKESDDCDCGGTLAGRFRRTIADLEESWAVKARQAPFYPFVTWTPEGARLGAATLLARNGRSEDDRLLALLSVAHACDVPANALKHFAWAEKEFHRGNLAKSAMHVALTGLPALVGSKAARRLHIAAGIFDHDLLTPLGLMKACGFDCDALDALVKYREDQPRVPKGNPDGGQRTRDGGGGSPASHDRSRGSDVAIVLPEGCEEEWAEARRICDKLLKLPNPPKGLTGGHTTVEGCAKGFVSERCGEFLMAFDEDMFALLKTRDWQACHRRIDKEGSGNDQETRFSITYWRSTVFEWQGRYDEALQILDAGRADFFTQCGYLHQRAEILCKMGKFADAIETLRGAPLGAEIDTFPALTYEAIFLYCYLLKRGGREPPPNLVAALPEDFVTRTWDGSKVRIADLSPPAGASTTPT